MTARIGWDQYEVALLIDACRRVMDGNASRADEIGRLSSLLRKRALSSGIEIDDVYRNTNGIALQMANMEYLLTSGKRGLPSASKLFESMASMYMHNRTEYEKFLQEAKGMIAAQESNKDQFFAWLSAKLSPAQLSSLYDMYPLVEAFCLKIHVLNGALFETTEPQTIREVMRTVESNKVFKFSHKRQLSKIQTAVKYYYQFIKENYKDSRAEMSVPQTSPADRSAQPTPALTFSLGEAFNSAAVEKPVIDAASARIEVETAPQPTDNGESISLPSMPNGDSDNQDRDDPKTRIKTPYAPPTITNEDKMLYKRYPLAYPRLYRALSTAEEWCGAKEVSIEALYLRVNKIMPPRGLAAILDRVSWANRTEKGYRFAVVSDAVVGYQDVRETMINATKNGDYLVVDYRDCSTYTNTRPCVLRYFDTPYIGFPSWQELYIKAIDVLRDDYPDQFPQGCSFLPNGSSIDYSNAVHAQKMRKPKLIGSDLYLETNLSVKDILLRVRALLDICNVDHENMIIEYTVKSDSATPSGSPLSKQPLYDHGSRADSRANANVEETERGLFTAWMMENDLKPATIRSYLSAISQSSKIGIRYKLMDSSFFEMQDALYVCTAFEALMANAEFVKMNREQHNRFRAALTKYYEFRKEASVSQYPKAPMQVANTVLKDQIASVLAAHFSNGFRLDSPIELIRFRSYAEKDLGEALTLSDGELKRYATSCGTMHEGKVYVVSNDAEGRIKLLVSEYFGRGARVIFFTEFYVKNESWLFAASIISVDMLIGILRRLYPKLSFTRTYFGYSNASVFTVLESEILRVWGENTLATYDQLAERLQYIPYERIRNALGQNGDFIWNSVGEFSHISRIEINDTERDTIRTIVARECNAHGFVSITDLPYQEIEEQNYELSVTAIHSAIYRICLSDKFDMRGKIITRKGDVFDALTIMKEHCRNIGQCSLDDLLDFEKELTGEAHRFIPMEAGYSILVRIDKETFVAEKYVNFDVDAIDKAVDLFVRGDYLPLKAFTIFGAFPDCGQTWNLFLLESYCRRFSRMFRFDTPSVNSKNVGAVIRKSCSMDYADIMTDAVISNAVPLTDAAIGRFLLDSGYMGRSTASKVDEIKNRAKAIMERRG